MGLSVTKAGERKRGVMVGLTGRSGAGKTTLAATFPKPLLLDLEGGSWVLSRQGTDVHAGWDLKPQHRQDEFMNVLRDVAGLPAGTYESVLVDSFTKLSEWIELDILEEDGSAESLNQAFGGYGRGGDAHAKRVGEVLKGLTFLQNSRGMHVVWIMHTKIGTEDLPTGESYASYGTQGNKKSAERLVMACDVVALLRQKVTVVDQKKNEAGKARGKGERELFVGSAPYADTKSRFHDKQLTLDVPMGVNPLADILGGAA